MTHDSPSSSPPSAPIAARPSTRASIALALIGCAPVFAQESQAPTVPPAIVTAGSGREPLLYDEPGDGSVWARGETYKAGFTREDALYAPFLGSDAPRGYPLSFRLAEASLGGRSIDFDSAVDPRRDGDTVLYERGALVEIYELAHDSIEQRFVFSELPERGEIVVRIATETDLVAREVEEGFRFETELGGVRYGRATALDADGRSVAAPTTLTDAGIEIRVPADFVACARLPLVIDPFVSTFTVSSDLLTSLRPDVAYDASTDRWLYVYEEIFNASDHDVVWRMFNSAGTFLAGGYVDGALSAWWGNPACGNLSQGNQFLVAAEVGLPTSGARMIQGRLISASSTTIGPAFLISTVEQSGDKRNPEVGGDPFDGGVAWYAVVWERAIGTTSSDIHARLVQGNGTLLGTQTILIENSSVTHDSEPSISKSNNATTWNLVWQRRTGSIHDLYGARMAYNGTIVASTFPIDTVSFADTRKAAASSNLYGTNRWMVAFERDADVSVYALDGSTVLDYLHLSGTVWYAMDTSDFEEQTGPDVDTDGFAFAVAYSESVAGSTTDFDVRLATVSLVGDRIAFGEGHQPMAFTGAREDEVSIAAHAGSGGALRRHALAWNEIAPGGSNLGDIEAGLYDTSLFATFCAGSIDLCPCGNSPTSFGRGCNNSAGTGGGRLILHGSSSLASDTLTLTAEELLPSSLAIFNQGDAVVPNAVLFGQGIRCVGGNLKRLYVKTASLGVAVAPGAGDPNVLARSTALGDPIGWGQTRYYYVYYRDPVVLGGCPSGSTYNATQSVQAIWIP